MAVAPPSLTKMGIHHLATAVARDYQPTLRRFRLYMREEQFLLPIAGSGSCRKPGRARRWRAHFTPVMGAFNPVLQKARSALAVSARTRQRDRDNNSCRCARRNLPRRPVAATMCLPCDERLHLCKAARGRSCSFRAWTSRLPTSPAITAFVRPWTRIRKHQTRWA